MAKTSFRSITDYIASKPARTRPVLEQVRRAIRRAVPAAEEGIAYQIPVFNLNGVAVLYFAGWKAHFSIYPANEALVAKFRQELAPYERSKGTIRMPLDEPVPVKLIERIARFRADQLESREKGKGARRGREAQLQRIRRIAATLPGVSEKLSHGAPSFFVEKDKGQFLIFADNHHEDGRIAVWLPVSDGHQALLLQEAPETYFSPPYVGSSGWIGIYLDSIRDDALQSHMRKAWQLVAAKMKKRQ